MTMMHSCIMAFMHYGKIYNIYTCIMDRNAARILAADLSNSLFFLTQCNIEWIRIDIHKSTILLVQKMDPKTEIFGFLFHQIYYGTKTWMLILTLKNNTDRSIFNANLL